MLELNRLNGDQIWINPDKIKMIFKSPDTTLVFIDDSRMTVKDSVDDVLTKMKDHQRSLSQPGVKE